MDQITEVVIRFSGPAVPTGEGFLVRLPSGEVVRPTAVLGDDEVTWRLSLAEPVADGVVAVRWQVKAPDAHPIDGSFSFTVAPPAQWPDGEASAQLATTAREVLDVPEVPVMSVPRGEAGPGETRLSPTVEEFLQAPGGSAVGASWLGYGGRFLGLGGTVVVVGLLVFATTVLRDSDPERARLIRSAGLGGAAAVVGAVFELVARAAGSGPWTVLAEASTWRLVFDSPAGVAVVLRSLGGAALLAGAWVVGRRFPASTDTRTAQLVPAAPRLTHADLGPSGHGAQVPLERAERADWRPVVVAGVGLLLMAVVFDGHTVTSGQRFATALIDIVHVSAGGVWVGGVAGLAVVLASRHRQGLPLDGLRLGMRFSTVAALASAVAGVAGAALAAIVLDDLGELISTSWGRILVAKVLLVALAASIGAYNHFIVLGAASPTPSQEGPAAHQLRRTVAVEAGLLLTVVGVTAALIASNSNA